MVINWTCSCSRGDKWHSGIKKKKKKSLSIPGTRHHRIAGCFAGGNYTEGEQEIISIQKFFIAIHTDCEHGSIKAQQREQSNLLPHVINQQASQSWVWVCFNWKLTRNKKMRECVCLWCNETETVLSLKEILAELRKNDGIITKTVLPGTDYPTGKG